MQRLERQRTMQYFKYLSSCAVATASDLQAQHTAAYDAVMQQVQADGGSIAVVGKLRGELQQVSQLYAQQLLHEDWARRFSAWSQQAEAAFGS